VIAHTRKVFYTTTADEYHGVLLQVMAFTTDIRGNFVTVNQTYTTNLT